MSGPDIAKIAAGLTKAQRETILDGRRCVASYEPAKKLIDEGIWSGERDEYCIYPDFTPLGLAVRAHLLAASPLQGLQSDVTSGTEAVKE